MTFTDKVLVSSVRLGFRSIQKLREQTGLTHASISVAFEAMQKRANKIGEEKRIPTCIVRSGVDSKDIRDQLLYPEPPLTIVGAA